MKWFLKTGVIIFFYAFSYGQGVSPLYFKHLNPRNGLSDPNIHSFSTDQEGFLWIGTHNGLNRFDGRSNVLIHPIDAENPDGDMVIKVLKNQEGNLWIGTQKGLSFYNYKKGNFKKYRFNEINNENFYYAFPFFEDGKGRLWSNLAGGIFMLDSVLHKISEETGGKSYVNQAWKHRVPWILTPLPLSGAAIHYLDGIKVIETKRFFEHQAFIKDIYVASDSLVWLASDIGLISLNPHTGLYDIFKQNYTLNSVKPFKNYLFLGSNGGGLLVFDLLTKKIVSQFKHLPDNPSSISSNTIDFLWIDEKENLFVAVEGKGVDYASLKKPAFTHFLDKQSALNIGFNNNITASDLLPSGEVWFGSSESGIISFKDNFRTQAARYFPKEGVNRFIKIGNDGILIEFKSLKYYYYSFHKQNFTQVYLNGLSKSISSSATDPLTGKTYITSEQGTALLAPDFKVKFLNKINQNTEWKNHQYLVFLDDDYALLQTYYTNLYLIKREKDDFKIIKEIARTPFNIHHSIKKGDTVFLATTSGLLAYDIVKKKLHKEILIKAFCNDVTNDTNGILWINSHSGIYSYNTNNKEIKRYYTSSGLQSTVFNKGTLVQLNDNVLISGGVNGINWFYPNDFHDEDNIVPAYITKILINDIAYTEENPILVRKLTLGYRENTLTFHISILDFKDLLLSKISYQMLGFDPDPVESSDSPMVRYAKMPPGKYKFMVYVNNKRASIPIEIEIRTPFWKTNSFYWMAVLVVILFSSTLVLLFGKWVKESQLERLRIMLSSQEEERKRIAVDLHDDLGGRLSTLKLYMQAVLKGMNPAQAEKVKQTTVMLDEAVNELRNILFNLSPKSLEENGIEAALEDLASNMGRISSLCVETNIETQNIPISKQVQYAVYRICQELISNTVKHANASKIFISLVKREDGLIFLYEDNGTGFDPETVNTGYGLTNIKTHAQTIFSELLIDSSPGKGTAATLNIPAKAHKF